MACFLRFSLQLLRNAGVGTYLLKTRANLKKNEVPQTVYNTIELTLYIRILVEENQNKLI